MALVVLITGVACPGGARATGLASTEWPMFHRDALHTGSADQVGPPSPQLRWFQGGAAIAPWESSFVPHGPQAPILSSAATSEVSETTPGGVKVWYFHNHSWAGRSPLAIRSEFPSGAQASLAIPLASAGQLLFETSSAMQFAGADPDTLNTLLFRNRDPNNNLDFVKQSDGTQVPQLHIPAGAWTFDFWISGVSADTNVNFTVYRFAHGAPDTRTALAGLNPVKIPVAATAGGARRVEFVQQNTNDLFLDPTDGIAIGVSVDAGSATLMIEGATPSRVRTPIGVPAIYAGADDGSVWAFDAATGNVLWSYAVAGAFFRSSPAVGDDGAVYIGSQEGAAHDSGRLYAFNPDGTLKWTYPSVNQVAYFRSAYLVPDVAANFPATTAPLYPFPGSGTHPAGFTPTIAATGTQLGLVQLIPGASNSALLGSPPPTALTHNGWLYQINPSTASRTLASGTWTLDLALRPLAANSLQAQGYVLYRISKVRIAGSPPTVQLQQELLGWTQDTQRLLMPPKQRVFAHIETSTVPGTTFVRGDYVFVELAIHQVAAAGAGGGWELLLDGENTLGGSDSALTTPGLSQAPIGAISSSPVISGDGVIYLATLGGEVHAVEADSGGQRWATTLLENNTPSEIRSSPVFTAAGKVYVGSMNGRLYALDGANGDILWRFPASAQAALGAIESSPAVDAGREQIYFGSDDAKVYAVRPVTSGNTVTPQLAWSFTTNASVTATPAIGPDGTIYVGSLDHNMYALNPADGTLRAGWPYTAAGEIASSPAVAGLMLSLYFVNQLAPEDASRLRLSTVGGTNAEREISAAFATQGANQTQKFAQEFRTRPQSLEPNLPTVLPQGRYFMHFWARASLQGSATAAISFKVFKNDSAVPLMTFPAQNLPNSATPLEFETQAQLTTGAIGLAATDYLRVEVWGSASVGAGESATVFFDFDGRFASRLETPVRVANTTLVYFATSVVRQAAPSPAVTAAGRIYCLDQLARVVWFDPNDGLAGFNPRGSSTPNAPTAFTASSAIWQIDNLRVVAQSGGVVTEIARRLDPTLYLGGNDGVMYCVGPTNAFAPVPPMLPPAARVPSLLSLIKQADKTVADVGQDITFTLRYRNDSSVLAPPAEDVVITDPIPQYTQWVGGGTPDLPLPTPATRVTWTLPMLWPQDGGQVQFTVRVLNTVPVVQPLGEEEPPRFAQPYVFVSHSDPQTEGVTQPVHPWDPEHFQWGDMLYIMVVGRGKPGVIVNSPAGAPATIVAATGEQAAAAPVTVWAGWGNRYRLLFYYEDSYQLAGLAARNQPVRYTTEIALSATDTRTGRPEEAYQYDQFGEPYVDLNGNGQWDLSEPLVDINGNGQWDLLRYPNNPAEAMGVTVFKVQLTPRGYQYSPTSVSATEAPNRPWTPYYWRVTVQQSRGGAVGRESWGPVWQVENLTDPSHLNPPFPDWDFLIHEPIEILPSSYVLNNDLNFPVNPGTQTRSTSFTVVNTSKHSLMGSGAVYPRNVVRWDKVDLAQAGPGYAPADSSLGYRFRDENYLPENRLNIGRNYASLAAGQREEIGGYAGLGVWGDIPRYLSPGLYQAPRAGDPLAEPATSDLPIYVDLNGNATWDPGETRYQHEYDLDPDTGQLVYPATSGTPFAPFSVIANIAIQPQVKIGPETVDLTKAAAAATPNLAAPASASLPTPPLLNQGNVDQVGPAAISLTSVDALGSDPLSGQACIPLARSDLPEIHLHDWRATFPLFWDWPNWTAASATAVPKTPVGAARPSQDWAPLGALYVAAHQPAAAYSGTLDAFGVVVGTDGYARIARDAAPVTARVVERRLTGYSATYWPVLGADTDPYAIWLDDNTLHLVWSAQRRFDGGDPTLANPPAETDPFFLRYAIFNRSANGGLGAWTDATGAMGQVTNYPNPADDPLDDPSRPVSKSHLTPGLGLESNGREWLFWGGSDLLITATGGHTYDNRLLWTSNWPKAGNAADIEQDPNVPGGAAASEAFRLQPRPVLRGAEASPGSGAYLPLSDGSSEYQYVVFTEQAGGQGSALRVFYRRRPSGGSWGNWTVAPLPLPADIVSARDPTAFFHQPFGQAQGQLWVIFSGVSSTYGTYDIWCARYAIGTLQLVPFPGQANGLRCLSNHGSDASNPSAFMESYRYKWSDGRNWHFEPAWQVYTPRLWVFWAQQGLAGQSTEILYQTLRWDAASSILVPEDQPRAVPVDHQANEFGLCAVKDPIYPQVWLFWSSTRGAPSLSPQPPAPDSDIYYQTFNPALP
jgi:uncharacterized repeat protein (TIGR01451 family)